MSRSGQAAEIKNALRDIAGVKTNELALQLANQLAHLQVWDKRSGVDGLGLATMLLAELQPKSALEAMLATQMVGVHHAATMFLARATLEEQTPNGTDANVVRATRLMKLFNEQLDALGKLRGKTSRQKVTVEHVHVHEGGQAIVGAVNQTKADRNGGRDDP